MPDPDDGFPDFNVKRAQRVLFERIRPQVRRFAHIMEQKFRLHDEERGDPYQNSSLDFLKNRLADELGEFIKCVNENHSLSNWEKEGADVGNILSMIVEWKRNSLKKGWGRP